MLMSYQGQRRNDYMYIAFITTKHHCHFGIVFSNTTLKRTAKIIFIRLDALDLYHNHLKSHQKIEKH